VVATDPFLKELAVAICDPCESRPQIKIYTKKRRGKDKDSELHVID
jgi:hypothetical protein